MVSTQLCWFRWTKYTYEKKSLTFLFKHPEINPYFYDQLTCQQEH